jgi:hypothetical protein
MAMVTRTPVTTVVIIRITDAVTGAATVIAVTTVIVAAMVTEADILPEAATLTAGVTAEAIEAASAVVGSADLPDTRADSADMVAATAVAAGAKE